MEKGRKEESSLYCIALVVKDDILYPYKFVKKIGLIVSVLMTIKKDNHILSIIWKWDHELSCYYH